MKKNLLFLIIVLILIPFHSTLEAHSGRTDSSGGHNCSAKSIAKGLCTDYHYHNGGGSSSSGSSSSSSSNIPKEPSGPTLEEIEAQDKTKGEEDGYSVGVDDGYNGAKENETIDTSSNAYQEGYSVGYNKGFEEGKKNLNSEKEKAYDAGYDAAIEGLKEAKHSENDLVQASYKEGYEKATAEIEAAKKEEYYTTGYEDGKVDVNNEPKDTKTIFIESYNKGYEKGQKELKDQYIKLGYEAAFTTLEYKKPDLEKEKYINWYKDGFNSNEEIDKIKDEAYKLGLNGDVYDLPKEYEKSEVIFSHHFEIGQKEYEVEKKENTQQTTFGLSVIFLGWLARRFYVARKIIS
ncbi:YHYH domain-containing protein [Gracilibacillus salitolerans]|uniref:YHYH domain-containing protein n=1 Tax=Gracilibacillus salitolerans TaxID=2663022 RepID=A0A5Q2TEI1_9BACI|nr:YHYH domain-containing protein [Gracilibacillus salitolerans]QGH33174.1 YHYH domain-containing protein [Gracilibacillus salitolerans]